MVGALIKRFIRARLIALYGLEYIDGAAAAESVRLAIEETVG